MENKQLLDRKRADVEKAAVIQQFADTDFGKLTIEWLNEEVKTLSTRLYEDDSLDNDNVARARIRGQLNAYQLIGKKMNIAKAKAQAAQIILSQNEPEPKDAAKQ